MLEAWHVEAIRQRINEGLRLRCINVTTTLELVQRDERDKQYLRLTSTSFNTVPVIHSAITIEEFGASVTHGTQKMSGTGEEVPTVRFYVNVHARYQGNGQGLFSVSGQVQESRTGVIFFEENKEDTVYQSDIEGIL